MTRTDALNDASRRRRWLALLVVSLTAFTAIALNAGSGSHLQAIDRQASQHLLAHGSGTWTVAMQWLARVHGVAGIAIVGSLWLAWLGLHPDGAPLFQSHSQQGGSDAAHPTRIVAGAITEWRRCNGISRASRSTNAAPAVDARRLDIPRY